mmetsp:Transcript_37774/g.105134  ORF Transcript_37774/g.105134 Transcript_37774/m.105134 type:complete len:241 (-) Transcript_37774:83-805(-)|eukprot:CAMPEP_0179076986 /NCGR_PEP_ID=MMETSP0796-20121207/34384_1 /TAXON_ID=73915 /ORGANISM="Pyrodinium bahamense, Strain pbaha01" /LENGTH=240 /DNA_ID=CAMNT_0020774257 /DNA_START=43 /DNA_END=765 /DNA_ORIENTATION=-
MAHCHGLQILLAAAIALAQRGAAYHAISVQIPLVESSGPPQATVPGNSTQSLAPTDDAANVQTTISQGPAEPQAMILVNSTEPQASISGRPAELQASNNSARMLQANNTGQWAGSFREIFLRGEWYPCRVTGRGEVNDTYNIRLHFVPANLQDFKNVPGDRLRAVTALQFTEATRRAKANPVAVQRAPALVRSLVSFVGRPAVEKERLREKVRLRRLAMAAGGAPPDAGAPGQQPQAQQA